MTDKKTKQRGLGRGLSALMADVNEDKAITSDAPKPADRTVPNEKIRPNPDQPRRSFDKDKLDDLAASIKEKGIIQPLIVRPVPGDDTAFEIVAGERRWRAAQMAKLHQIPVLVRDFNDTEVLEIAIIENIQRADLNPVEEAAGYRQLMDKFGHTQEKLAEVLGKSRSHIANMMRLLTLPDEVQEYLSTGRLSVGHARALIGHPDAVGMARSVLQDSLSVRQTEALVKRGIPGKARPAKPKAVKDADTLQIEKELSAQLRMKVSIDHAAESEGGKMTISYRSLDQLDDLMRVLSG